MSPRPRSYLNSQLPPNLSLHGTGQYRYVHPVSKKDHYLGTDRTRAIEAARKLNALLLPSNPLVERVLRVEHKLAECVDLFEREEIPARKWKPKTAKEYGFRLKRIRADLGGRCVEALSVKDCATYLREATESLRAREQYRTVLMLVLDVAVQEGWVPHNVARATRVAKPERQRQRLTLDAYNQIWEHAPEHLRNAMDLSLHTLLRRADVAAMRFEDVRDGFLFVIPRKTESTSYVRLKIGLVGELAAVVERCRDEVVSPYLVHRLPKRLKPHGQRAKERQVHTQLLPEDLSREFRAAVEASGAYEGESNPPTFHEIRSLGADLYRQAGWSLDRLQALMGHESASMTKHYLAGHDAPWVEVAAGLTVAKR